jgi:hypothetical protein
MLRYKVLRRFRDFDSFNEAVSIPSRSPFYIVKNEVLELEFSRYSF